MTPDNHIIVDLHGVHFGNKGAQLMLLAILEHFASSYPGFRFCMSPRNTFSERSSLGLYQRFILPRIPYTFNSALSRMIPNKLLFQYGIVTDSDIDFVLDASGFNYSEQWGPEKAELAAGRYEHLKKSGKKVILLPQALGPFSQARTCKAMMRIIRSVELIFARDHVSYDHLIKLAGDQPKIKIAPDFTGALNCKRTPYINLNNDSVAIVPNIRVIENGHRPAASEYLNALIFTCQELHDRGLEPLLLVFERGDISLCKSISDKLQFPIRIIEEENPLTLKWILGHVKFSISSRFHALVCALSQGIPCIGIGWSHKYDALFQDYNIMDFLICADNHISNNIQIKLNLLFNERHREVVTNRILSASLEIEKQVTTMWTEVHKILQLSNIRKGKCNG